MRLNPGLKNAIKYTYSGKVSIVYSIVKTAQPKSPYVQFDVTDTGPGIPEELRPVIFDRFIRAEMKDMMINEGSGLGLTIAKV